MINRKEIMTGVVIRDLLGIGKSKIINYSNEGGFYVGRSLYMAGFNLFYRTFVFSLLSGIEPLVSYSQRSCNCGYSKNERIRVEGDKGCCVLDRINCYTDLELYDHRSFDYRIVYTDNSLVIACVVHAFSPCKISENDYKEGIHHQK